MLIGTPLVYAVMCWNSFHLHVRHHQWNVHSLSFITSVVWSEPKSILNSCFTCFVLSDSMRTTYSRGVVSHFIFWCALRYIVCPLNQNYMANALWLMKPFDWMKILQKSIWFCSFRICNSFLSSSNRIRIISNKVSEYTLKKISDLPSLESLPLYHRPILSSVGPKKFRDFCF